jgi:hypothetical protein
VLVVPRTWRAQYPGSVVTRAIGAQRVREAKIRELGVTRRTGRLNGQYVWTLGPDPDATTSAGCGSYSIAASAALTPSHSAQSTQTWATSFLVPDRRTRGAQPIYTSVSAAWRLIAAMRAS